MSKFNQIDIDAQEVADLIKAGDLEGAEVLYKSFLFGLRLWESLALQDRIRTLSGPSWPEQKPL